MSFFSRIGKKGVKFLFQFIVHDLANFQSNEPLYVVAKKKSATSSSDEDHRTRVSLSDLGLTVWKEAVTLSATLYVDKKDARKWDPKPFLLQVKSVRQPLAFFPSRTYDSSREKK